MSLVERREKRREGRRRGVRKGGSSLGLHWKVLRIISLFDQLHSDTWHLSVFRSRGVFGLIVLQGTEPAWAPPCLRSTLVLPLPSLFLGEQGNLSEPRPPDAVLSLYWRGPVRHLLEDPPTPPLSSLLKAGQMGSPCGLPFPLLGGHESQGWGGGGVPKAQIHHLFSSLGAQLEQWGPERWHTPWSSGEGGREKYLKLCQLRAQGKQGE